MPGYPQICLLHKRIQTHRQISFLPINLKKIVLLLIVCSSSYLLFANIRDCVGIPNATNIAIFPIY